MHCNQGPYRTSPPPREINLLDLYRLDDITNLLRLVERLDDELIENAEGAGEGSE